MSILSRAKQRFFEDGISGLVRALSDRLIAPIHVRLLSYGGSYVMERHGVTVDLSRTSLSPLVKYRMRTNFLKYEQQESVAVSRFLDPELDVVELGAGIGFVSCLVNSKLSEAATHVAVEANPKLIESLERNRELNDATFDIHHAAYSPTDSSVGLNVYDDFRSTGVFDKKGKTGREVTVAGVNLASIVRQYDIDHFTLVADIEGVEADLLLEEWGTISQKCETLIVEFHDRNPNTSLARSKLTDSDFECLYTNSDVEVWSR